METALRTGVVGLTSFGLGWYEGSLDKQGRDSDFAVFNVPIPLVIAIASHGAAFFGVGRGMEPHLRAVGDGALAVHANFLGRQAGAGAGAGKGKVSGESYLLGRQGAGLTEADLARLAL